MNQNICKNKECHRPLPDDYKHKYCENCRNKKAQQLKNFGKGLLSLAAIIVTVASKGNIKIKK